MPFETVERIATFFSVFASFLLAGQRLGSLLSIFSIFPLLLIFIDLKYLKLPAILVIVSLLGYFISKDFNAFNILISIQLMFVVIFSSLRRAFRNQFLILLFSFCGAVVLIPLYRQTLYVVALESFFLFTLFVNSHLLLLRHDIENHHIIKHRIGRESRMVEVERLLKSRKVLDPWLRNFIFATSAFLVVTTLILSAFMVPVATAVKKVSSWTGFNVHGNFNLNTYGKLNLSKKLLLEIKSSEALKGRLYLEGVVLSRYEKGIWYPVNLEQPHKGQIKQKIVNKIEVKQYEGIEEIFAPIDGTIVNIYGNERLIPWNGLKVIPPPSEYTIVITNTIRNDPFFKSVSIDNQAVNRVAGKLEKEIMKGGFVLDVLNKYFEHFDYSDDVAPSAGTQDPVEYFLEKTRKGPCGLYASAAVLILRQLGYRADLVLGFSRNGKDQKHVRFTGLDAHSWVRVFIPDKGWIVYDPTVSARISARQVHRNESIVANLKYIALVILLLITGFYIFHRFNTGHDQENQSDALSTIPAPRKASITSYEASMIFQEIAGNDMFMDIPRMPGESAVNYARRVRNEGHQHAGILITASNLANDILFSTIDDESRLLLLKHLKEILTNLEN
ncbi:transglutaminase-like domain-containing protein [Myxococcota bacterium]|nr:transglutaminase-like domain-containing protein [Myxococcota bacterium]MBU1498693.1 transglutaminase-like domain-containing protein [Myxococcota bacterium]